MQIKKIITTCNDCRHRDHSGAFTKGGAKPACGHPCAAAYATARKLIKDSDEKYHWRYRTLKKVGSALQIPAWCPLKHGEEY